VNSLEPIAFEPDRARVARVGRALAGVPRAAYSVPHVYPSAAPAFEQAPMAERPQLLGDELRLYVHIPYCRYRCTFCYFAVRVGAGHDAMARYVAALEQELDWLPPGKGLSQLFVGGGTPTALPPELLERVLAAVQARTTRHPDKANVHTIETSPETISTEHVDAFRRHGVGRVSMGVQSLDEEVLDTVHRDQTALGAIEACELLVDSGLIVNIDLIYGLPGQKPADVRSDLERLARLGVPSFTLYSLRVTERTSVRHRLGDDRFDLARLMSWRAFVKQAAEDLGYTQTRWHTFKRLDTVASRHERLPCFDDDMRGYQLGVGMSARSHLGRTVYRNHEIHDRYVDRIETGQSPVEQVFPLAEEDLMTQFVARSLGDGRPLARAGYEATFGRPIDADFGDVLARLRDGGLVVDDGEVIALSDGGALLYDLVTLAFYPERARAWLAEREEKASFITLTAVPG
jgi:oxygen-independent coproporphyrinogen-3 oxidase